jgi:hypothetical protein
MKWLLIALAIAVGLLFGTLGHGSGPAPIAQLAGAPRLGAHILMAIALFGALGLATYCSVRYAISGDPPTVHYIDQATGDEIEPPAAVAAREVRHGR